MKTLADGPHALDLFRAIGLRHGVRDIVVLGDVGAIEGSLADDHIIAEYAKLKTWKTTELTKLVGGYFDVYKVGTYVDVGANLGLTTIPIAAMPGVDCIAFEPDPDNFRHLVRNVTAHCRHNNVKVHEIAVCNHNGEISFECDPHNHGDHRIHVVKSGVLMESERTVVKVPACRLDDWFDVDKLKQPIVVKMDVQGSEGHIFAGGERLLSKAELVFMEYWPYSMVRFDSDIGALLSFITKTYSTGSMVLGDQDIAPDWQPIAEVVKAMRQRWNFANIEPFTYHEIYLRK